MIDKEKFHVLEYVKKSEYLASMDGMRYMLRRIGDEEMEVVLWPEPNSYGATDEALKQRTTLPLTAEGVEKASDYLNEQYEAQRPLWELSHVSTRAL